jgi:hypothetical protein
LITKIANLFNNKGAKVIAAVARIPTNPIAADLQKFGKFSKKRYFVEKGVGSGLQA